MPSRSSDGRQCRVPSYAERDLAITTEIDAPARLGFDQEDMLELIGNLIDNAAKWAARRVRLRLSAGDGLHLDIDDDGPGVPEEAAATLAQRTSCGGSIDPTDRRPSSPPGRIAPAHS